MVHEKKTWPESFQRILEGKKTTNSVWQIGNVMKGIRWS